MKDSYFGRVGLKHFAVSNLIQWGDELSVDHPQIDAQHKAIWQLGAEVYESWRRGDALALLRPTAERLGTLLRAHFFYEEQILSDIAYEGLQQHIAEHNSMLGDLQNLEERLLRFSADDEKKIAAGSVLAPGWAITQFILEFTIGHVTTSDMEYRQALAASRDWVQGTA